MIQSYIWSVASVAPFQSTEAGAGLFMQNVSQEDFIGLSRHSPTAGRVSMLPQFAIWEGITIKDEK